MFVREVCTRRHHFIGLRCWSIGRSRGGCAIGVHGSYGFASPTEEVDNLAFRKARAFRIMFVDCVLEVASLYVRRHTRQCVEVRRLASCPDLVKRQEQIHDLAFTVDVLHDCGVLVEYVNNTP